MKTLTTFLVVFLGMYSLKAQFEENYRPLEFEGDIPSHFSKYLQGNLSDDYEVPDGYENLSSKQQGTFRTLTQYALIQAMRSGSVYLNPEINDYLNRLVDYLLKDDS